MNKSGYDYLTVHLEKPSDTGYDLAQYFAIGKGFDPKVLHPTAQVGKNLIIGQGVVIEKNVVIGDDCFIGHNSVIRPNSIIGDRCVIRSNCLIDPNVLIGSDFNMYPHATVGGGTIVEPKVYFGPYSLTTNSSDIRNHRPQTAMKSSELLPPVIKSGAVIYAGCMIAPGVVIGKNSVLGMGSVLTKSIPDNEVWFGNPASYRYAVKASDRIIENE